MDKSLLAAGGAVGHMVVAVGSIVVLGVAFAHDHAAVGHRLKSGVILLGAVILYAAELHALYRRQPIRSVLGPSSHWRAMVVFLGFLAAALLTLVLDWRIPWQAWIGVATQLAVGIVGVVQCAAIITTPAHDSLP